MRTKGSICRALIFLLMIGTSVAVLGQCVNAPNTTMVAWYPFDETTGNAAANLATQNTGTEFGAPTHIAGKVGGALHFNGNTSQWVDSPSTIMTNFGPAGTFPFSCSGVDSSCYGNFAIDLWIRVPSTLSNSVKTILDKRTGAFGFPLQGYHFALSYRRLILQMDDNGVVDTTFASPALLPDPYDENWHHIAVSVIRLAPPGFTAPQIDFYYEGGHINPALVTASNGNPRTGSLVNNSVLRIGANTAANPLDNQFEGDMDELEIYNRDLTAAEVQAIFNAGSSGKCKP